VHEGLEKNPPAAKAKKEPPNPLRPLVAPVEQKRERLDLFGDPLPAEALGRLGTVRFRPGSHITSLTFTNDGTTIIAKTWSGVRVWESRTGKELARFATVDFANCAASPDGKLIATLANDRPFTLALWELGSGRQVRILGQTDGNGRELCFSPDGKILATFGWVHNELWDVATGKRLRSWDVGNYRHADGIYAGAKAAAFTRDSKTLITGGFDKAIRFWDVATGKQTREIAGVPNPIEKLTLSPDDKLLATIGFTVTPIDVTRSDFRTDSFVRIWDLTAGKEVRQLRTPAGETSAKYPRPFNAMAFSPDGRSLVTGGPASVLRVLDPISGRELRRLALDCPNPWAMSFSPDGKTLAVTVGGQSVRLFDWPKGKDRFPVVGHQGRFNSAVVSGDAKVVATINSDITILWDAVTGRQRHRHTALATSSHLCADRRTALCVGEDKTLRRWDLATGKELEKRTLDRCGDYPLLLAVSAEDRLAAVMVENTSVALLDLISGKELHRLAPVKLADGAGFTLDGRTLTVWTYDGVVHVWDAVTGRKLRQVPFPPEPVVPRPQGLTYYTSYKAALSPDGKLMAYGRANDPVLVLQDLATGKEVHRLTNLPDRVGPIAFSRDGRTLAWGGLSGTIGLVEVATGRQRYQFPGRHGDGVASLVFSADGRKLIAGNYDTSALVWDLTGRLSMNADFREA